MKQIETKLSEIRSGKASEYLVPLNEIREAARIRTEVSEIAMKLKLQVIKTRFEAETLGAKQTYEVRAIVFGPFRFSTLFHTASRPMLTKHFSPDVSQT